MNEYERAESRRKRSHTGAIALMVTLMILIVASVGILFLPESKKETKGKKPSPTAAQTQQPVQQTGEEQLAVVLSVDTRIKTVTLYDVQKEQEQTVAYTGGTVFSDSFGGQLTAAQLEPGMMLYVNMDTADHRIISAAEPDFYSEKESIWEKQNEDGVTVTDSENRISFANRNYKYSDGICVMSGGKRISLDDILPMDRVTVRGEDAQIYEIIVTKGHGTLSLVNHEDFIGGTILIGGGMEFRIEEAAEYLVKEGTYKVTVAHGEYTGTQTITVARDTVTEFDVFEYGRGPVRKGTVVFTIEPFGAALYIDGKRTEYYGEELTLDYGVYQIEAAAGGYITYKASITVNSGRQALTIYLTENTSGEQVTEPDDPTKEPETGGNESTENTGDSGNTGSGGSTGGSGSTGTVPHTSVSIADRDYVINANNAIYILGPEGAMVYLNGELLGTAPIDFEKIIGSYLLTIVLEDGTVKNFNCTETDNGEDSYYNFN